MTSRAGLVVFYRDLAFVAFSNHSTHRSAGIACPLAYLRNYIFPDFPVFSTHVVCDRGSESSCGPSICYGLAYGNKNVATPYRRITAAAARHAGHVNFGPTPSDQNLRGHT